MATLLADDAMRLMLLLPRLRLKIKPLLSKAVELSAWRCLDQLLIHMNKLPYDRDEVIRYLSTGMTELLVDLDTVIGGQDELWVEYWAVVRGLVKPGTWELITAALARVHREFREAQYFVDYN